MSFPKYPEYKDSGVGWLREVPSHWEVLPSRRLFSQQREPRQQDDEQLSATQKYGVLPQTLFMELEDQKVTLALSGLDNFKHVEVDDFVISLRSFQGGIEWSKYSGCVSPAYTVLRSSRSVNAAYWSYALKSTDYIGALQAVTDGIRDGKNIGYDQFGMIGLPYPTIQEQSAIAAFLDRETAKIDALVAEQEKLIELLKEKRQAVISHAVTKGLDPNVPMKDSGVEWLGEVPEHWEVAKLRRFVLAVQTGGTPSASPPNTDIEDGTDWFTPGDFSGPIRLGSASKKVPPEAVKQGEAKVFPAGAVLVVGIGATLGKIGYLLTLASANQQINAILPNAEVDGLFLAYSLSSKTAEMRYLSNASTIGIMNQEKTKEVWLAVPPLCEQEGITKFLDEDGVTSGALVNEAQRAIDLLKERRSALISAAVTGKIDVRGLAEATQ